MIEHDFRYSHQIGVQRGTGANVETEYLSVCRHCGIVRRGPAEAPPTNVELVAAYSRALDDAQKVIEQMFAANALTIAEFNSMAREAPYSQMDVGEQECEIVSKRYLADLEVIAKHWCSGLDYIGEPHHSAAKRLRAVWDDEPSHDVRHEVS